MAQYITKLIGLYGRMIVGGISTPVAIVGGKDETGKPVAWVALRGTDRKTGATIAGEPIEEIDLKANIFVTLDRWHRRADASGQSYRGGAMNLAAQPKRFQLEIARIGEKSYMNLMGLTSQEWFVEQYDAKKAGITLPQLRKALKETYTQ
jgi:hypothetical protein